jgi:hypothetical protein
VTSGLQFITQVASFLASGLRSWRNTPGSGSNGARIGFTRPCMSCFSLEQCIHGVLAHALTLRGSVANFDLRTAFHTTIMKMAVNLQFPNAVISVA